MSRNSLSTNQELHRGDYLISNDGNFKAIFQDDGNFVVYTWKPVWASNTDGKPGTRLVMQADGNLVIYDVSGHPFWASNSYQNSNGQDFRLTLSNDVIDCSHAQCNPDG
ncbi:B-type lectin plumieribetin-like isoform X2 [Hoplias malabaricus]|uniref:B-type lectin plumieribetin-like isoform X2 n=1 Tax=Hoplias malabaricus TaxID=27720 RepID=UPI0034629910